MNLLQIGILYKVFIVLFVKEAHGGSFSIINSKMFRIDNEETVVVNLHGYGNTAVTVFCELTDYPYQRQHISEVRTSGNSGQPISFKVKVGRKDLPGATTLSNKAVQMNIRIAFQGNRYPDINKAVKVLLNGDTDYIFIQTNRPIYRPGEEVQIRVIPLNLQMVPIKDKAIQVSVQTPDEVGVWKRFHLLPDDNILEATYRIPDDPPLGKWFVKAKINDTFHASSTSTAFLIEKYVLPTYDITLKLAKTYVKPGDDITGNFTAMYSYGEPVVGIYALVASVSLPGSEEKFDFYKRPSSVYKRAQQLRASNEGFAKFTIPTNQAANVTQKSWSELVELGATISVQASVMGLAEGVFESDVKEGVLITNSPYVIDMSHTSPFFIPSSSHELKIIVRDVVSKKPVPQVPVQVTGAPTRRTGRTDENGEVGILVDVPSSDEEFSVTVGTADPGLANEHQSEIPFTLRRIQSNSFLRIIAPQTASVDGNIFLKFEPRGARPKEVYYLVQARGLILLTGKKTISNRGSIASQQLTITRKMSPSIRVIAYYVQGREIVSDSVWIDIEDTCISKELTITPNPTEVPPNGGIDLGIAGQAQAVVGIAGVDRAAYFLNNEGRLDREGMFEKMNSFDMGCLLSGGSTGLNVFEDAGLTITPKNKPRNILLNQDCSQEQQSGNIRKKRNVPYLSDEFDFTALQRKCLHDGRLWKYAEDPCGERLLRVKKWEIDHLPGSLVSIGPCRSAFMQGCIKGEFLKNISKMLERHARRGVSGRKIDMGSFSPGAARSRFLESWMWRKADLNSNGDGMISVNAPDSITTYDIDAVSIHETEGFCVAKPAEVKVFKKVFIKLFLPYSIKVLEQVQIRAAVFNYHESQNLSMILKLKGDRNLCSQYTPGEWSDVATFDIASQSSKSFSFTFLPLKVPVGGEVTIELKVVLSTVEISMDEVERKLKVEESGSQEELSGSLVLDAASPNQNHQFRFHFPDDNVLPETKKCSIYGHMSFLGPIIEFDPIGETPKNLADSLQKPYGCGEQNMMVCGPNAFAFNYLKARRNPTAEAEEKIKTYIKDGYTRQLGHRNNGVWSVYSSSAPTIWLNAFVDKTFLHARKVWPEMDVKPICRSIAWIIDHQGGDGRFSETQHAVYYTIHVSVGGDVSLTAYVVMALSETRINCPDPVRSKLNRALNNAVGYLRRHVGDEIIVPYTAALLAYALALIDPRHSSTTEINRRLWETRFETSEEIYWKSSPDNVNDIDLPPWYHYLHPTIDIETTAYALLAQVTIAAGNARTGEQRRQELAKINKIARWLVNQRNDRGGWQTSQTTVTAIQALTNYETWFETLEPPPRNPRLNMLLESRGSRAWREQFTLDGSNEFYRKEIKIPGGILETSNTIDVQLQSGQGRGSLSYRCTYRVTSDSEVCHFNIHTETSLIGLRDETGTEEAEPGRGKNVIKLLIIVEKSTAGDSSMAIIDIGLISGFRPIEATLQDLTIKDRVDGIIDRYEITEQNVLLYVNKIPSNTSDDLPLKIAFSLQQYVEVKHPNPAKIKVYDYYTPEIKCDKFYTIPDGMPMLSFDCLPSSIDHTGEKQCKCLAGGCPTCRTREEQLTKSCGRKYHCSSACSTWRESECFNMHKSVCNRNFGYIVEIATIDERSMPGFVKINAHVKEILRTLGDQGLKAEQERVFILRKKCHDACQDNTLKSLKNDDYFAPGRVFLIMGKKPENSVKSDGNQSIRYYLDEQAVIERALAPDKCKRFEKKRIACRNERRTEICRKILPLLKICDNQDEMRKALAQGCDL